MRRLAAALLLVACAAEGDRQDGGCPAGEMCSELTPNGLFFLGSALGDQSLGRMQPLAVALGGTQSIRVVTGESSTSAPFSTSFVAASSGDALAIGSVAPPDVEVLGLEAGEAFLRIVEPGSNLLFDRIAIAVQAVARVEVVPESAALDEDFMDGGVAWALLAGGHESVVVRLFALDGTRLADESLNLAVSGGLSAGAREAWDTLRVGGGGAAGTLVVRPGDGMRRDAPIPLATGIDDVVSVPAIGGAAGTDEPQSATRPAIFCFRAVTAGTPVAGATWGFSGSTGLTITPLGSCASVRSELPAAGLLTVTASGVTREFAVSFAAGKPGAAAAARGAAAGERAITARRPDGSPPPAPR